MKIAIIRLSSLGDIIHALWTVQFVKKRFPESEITWICDSSFKDIVKCCPHIDRVVHIPLRKNSFIKSLKTLYSLSKEKFDYVIDMQGLIKSAIVSRVISREVYGFSKQSAREKYSALLYRHQFNIPYKKNIFLRNLELISKILDIEISENEITSYSKYLEYKNQDLNPISSNSNKKIIFIPSSSMSEKNIPESTYIEIISKLDLECYMIWGNENEYEKCIRIKEKIKKLNILPKLGIDDLIHVFSEADIIVGSDTGPTHIAFALKKPSITIYWDKAKSSFKRNSFVTSKNKVLSFPDLSNINSEIILNLISELI